jgi:hypothetical protein
MSTATTVAVALFVRVAFAVPGVEETVDDSDFWAGASGATTTRVAKMETAISLMAAPFV